MRAHTAETSIERLGDLTVFDIRGYVSMDSGPAIEQAYDIIDPKQVKKILLRFDNDTYFNSEGLKSIFQILQKAKKNDQQVGITALSKHFTKIFGMVGITRLAKIFENEEDALAGLGAKEK